MDKGRAERELLTLQAEAKKAIERWLGFCNAIDPDAALFVSLSSGGWQSRASAALASII